MLKDLPKILVLLAFSIAIAIVFSKIVPFNMDEFIHYHWITCHHYKWNALNTFRESCQGYDLNFLNTGLILPLRTYHYSGNFPSIYYYPIFLLWKSPYSARFMGLVFLLIQALVLSRIFRLKTVYIFLGLILFFPYFFQHMVDTGHTGFQTTTIYLTYLLLCKWLETLKIKYPLFIAIIIFLGIWTKLSYFWVLPGLLILFLFIMWQKRETVCQKENKLRLLKHMVISLLVLGALLYALFSSTNPVNSNDKPYVNILRDSESHSLKEIFNSDWNRYPVMRNFLNPYEATQRIYAAKPITNLTKVYNIPLYLLVPFLLLISWFKSPEDRKDVVVSGVFYTTFLITVLMIIRTKASFFMHHAVLAFPFLILSIISTLKFFLKSQHKFQNPLLSKTLIARLCMVFFLLNLYYFFTFSSQPIHNHDDPSKIKVNAILNDPTLAERYFYVVIDWGMYYYQGLYGPKNQSVIYMEPLNSSFLINQLKDLARIHKRKMLFIHNSRVFVSNLRLISSSFDVERCKAIDESAVWQILIEKDEQENICQQVI